MSCVIFRRRGQTFLVNCLSQARPIKDDINSDQRVIGLEKKATQHFVRPITYCDHLTNVCVACFSLFLTSTVEDFREIRGCVVRKNTEKLIDSKIGLWNSESI